MKCGNARTLSYISAGLQLGIFILVAIAGLICIAILYNKDDLNKTDLRTTIFGVVLIFVIAFPVLATLLVGIKQNRPKLIGIFVYVAHILLAIFVVKMIYDFIMGFVHKEEYGKIFHELIMECIMISIEFILTLPIERLHKQLHHSTPSDVETEDNKEEQYGLSSNQPVHKPKYEA